MNKWKKEVDAGSLFINQSLDSITFTENTMVLNFSNGASITVLYGFEFSCNNKEKESIGFPISSTRVLSALGMKVKNVSIINDRDLFLVYSEGCEMNILSSEDSYECYIVRFGGVEIVI